MSTTSKSRPSVIKLALCLVLLGLAFVPFDHTVAPEWSVLVLDQGEKPVAGVGVIQFWDPGTEHFTAYKDALITDSQGRGVFRKKTVRMSIASKAGCWISELMDHGFHGDCYDISSVIVDSYRWSSFELSEIPETRGRGFILGRKHSTFHLH